SQAEKTVDDKTFGKQITWDIPLLEGYEFSFVPNVAKKPGVHHFQGIDCPELIDQIKAYAPNAVLVFGWNFKSHLKTLRHFHGKIPVWFRGDSTLLNETGGVKTKLRRLVLSWVYQFVDKALYVGEENKLYFLRHGLKANELVFVPHAIDNERFSDDIEKNYEVTAQQWRAELGIPTSAIVLLYAGKFEPNKQLEFLIDAVIEVNKQREDKIILMLVGNGPLENELKSKVKAYDFVFFKPFQNQTQMPIVYRLGNVFCLPSISETWGLAINEAMACSRPVIVSDRVGCSKDLIIEDTNGWIFDYRSGNELIQILKSLEFNDLNSKGKVASRLIQQWSFDTIAASIEKALENEK
ncbi:MAG: glycosyltransferase family 4 protein, partial [Gelidibacter sp.]